MNVRMVRTLFVLAALAVAPSLPLAAQTMPGRAEIAVFRGQPLDAQALASLGALDRAWLEAAQKPAFERARSFLALADAHPELRERALLGAAGALLTARRLARSVPGLIPDDDDGVEFDSTSLASTEAVFESMIERLERLHEQVRRAGASADLEAEAHWMLCMLRRVGDPVESMQVPSGSELHVPAPRPHEIELGWFRCPDLDWEAIAFERRFRDAPAVRTERVPAGNEAVVTGVPAPGSWMLELRETRSGWRLLRPVLVSDLAVDCLALGSHVVVFARLGNQPAGGATVTLRSTPGVLIARGRCNARGLAGLVVPSAYLEDPDSYGSRVEVCHGPHRAHVGFWSIGRPLAVCEELRAHVFCERPLVRPGEVVRGRIFVRRIEGGEGGPRGRPVRGGSCRLRLWPGGKDEQVVRGELNARGVFTFAIRIPKTAKHGRVRGELNLGGEKLELRDMFRVDPFRRSPLRVELKAPERISPGQGAEAELRARWSHGAAASLAPVSVQARIGGLTHELETRLGQDGTLRIALPDDEAFFAGSARVLELRTTVRGPDGQGVTGTAEIRLPEEPAPPSDGPRFVGPKERLRAGGEAHFRLRYQPNTQGLFVLWMRDHLEARAVRFDAEGLADLPFKIPENARGLARIEFTGEGRSAGRSVRIACRENDLRIDLETRKRSYLPGGKCRLAFRVTNGAGHPVRAILCASVVDERILALEDVDDLAAAKRFGRLRWHGRSHDASARPTARPWRLIGEMLADGRPRANQRTWAYNGPAGTVPSGGVAALGIPEELLRKRFRPSAGFRACLRTDEKGRASYAFALPDDLTTWRLRVAAVDEGLGQGAARFKLVTEKPLSVEAALPRFLRVGDRIHTTPAVSAPAGTTPAWAADAGDELTLERGEYLADGIRLHARSRGKARFELGVRAGDLMDALRRVLPVQRDTVREALHASGKATGEWRMLDLPGADELDALVIGAGRGALLAGLRERLATYPYRCAEQTSSRLLGLFGRRVPEEARAALEAEAMFARLGQLWHSRSLLYSWWPARPGDREITALVLHALSELKAAGHPLARFGLDVSSSKYELQAIARAVPSCTKASQSPDIAAAEHAIALLRLGPGNKDLRAAVQAFLRGHSNLPRGLLCRAGLALAAAGRRDAALEIARAVRRPGRARIRGLWLGELDRVQLAFELRLRQELGLDNAETRSVEEKLVRDIESQGFGNTWAAACALHALSERGTAERLPETFAAEVRVDGKRKTITLERECRYRAKLPLKGRPRVEVRSPSGMELCVRLLGARYVAAESFQPKGRGLRITRSIQGVAAASALERGRIYRMAFEITAVRPARYLVVRCPLPAGCEVQGRPAGIVRHDDAFVATIARVHPEKPRHIEVPVAFGFEGSVVWPPAHVQEMYGETTFAYGSGSRLRVGPGVERGVENRPVVSVLSEAWRRARIDVLLERAMQAENLGDARYSVQAVADVRLPLTAAQCEKWLEPLFARHRDQWFRYELLGLPGVRDAPAEPTTAVEFACALHRGTRGLALRRKLLEAPDPVFERVLVKLAAGTEAAIEDGIDEALRIGAIRHEAVSECPAELADELALAEAIFARVERSSAFWDEWEIAALEDLAELSGSAPFGAAEGPVEAGIRKRLEGLRKRAAALRARHVPPGKLSAKEKLEQDIDEHRWDKVPRAHWPKELDRLEPEDVEAFTALGEVGIRYLIEQANGAAWIWDEAHWLRTVASGPTVDLGVLTPLLQPAQRTSSEGIVAVDRIRRVPSLQLVAACRRDPTPYRRVLYLTELARRGEGFPLRADRPAERPYYLVWRCLHGDSGSKETLEAFLFPVDPPEKSTLAAWPTLRPDTDYRAFAEFTLAAWPALLPDPGYRVFAAMVGEMTEREHAVSFAHLDPAERRRALEEFGVCALPPTLSDALLREFRGELWSRILGDAGKRKFLLPYFLESEYGISLLREQLACAHAPNLAIARSLLMKHGLSVPFRTKAGLVLRLEARDEDTREQLALQWLDGEVGYPDRHVPQAALRRILRRRGCSLR